MLSDQDLQKIGTLIDERLEEKLEPMKKDVSSMKRDIKKLRKDQSAIVRVFDTITSKHHKRLDRLEEHVGLSRHSS